MKNKKALAVLLVVAMLFAGISASVFAATTAGVTVAYDFASKSVTITVPKTLATAEIAISHVAKAVGLDVTKAPDDPSNVAAIANYKALEKINIISAANAEITFVYDASFPKDDWDYERCNASNVVLGIHNGVKVFNEANVGNAAAWEVICDKSVVTTTKEATCLQTGVTVKACSVCGAVIEEVHPAVDPKNHEISEVSDFSIPANCTEHSAVVYSCGCADCLAEAAKYPVTGPTDYDALRERYVALAAKGMAKIVYGDEVLKGHVFDMDNPDVEPTLFENGKYHCDICSLANEEIADTSILYRYNELIVKLANMIRALLININVEYPIF